MHERTNHPGILFRSTVDEVPARPSHALSNLRIRYPSRLLIYVQCLIAEGLKRLKRLSGTFYF